MPVVLISTYDMGRQPFGLASPVAWLRAAGFEGVCVDLSVGRLPEDAVRSAAVVGFFLPMHTATRLSLPVIDAVRALNPRAYLVAYGLYAPLNASLLRERGVSTILGGEFEQALVECVRGVVAPGHHDSVVPPPARLVPRLAFKVPDRTTLLPLGRYASLQHGVDRRVVGYTEASRGCKHRCRHCPIVPVYDGQFRVVPVDVVLADIQAQVVAGARHITFGDPDFFNGPRHAAAIVERLAQECPGVSYDVTIKVEHLLKHSAMLTVLRDTGCAFVTTAVESVDDRVLALLEKGHTRADFERVVGLSRDVGLALAPTFVAFTPWTSIDSYLELLQTIDRLDLVEHVAPIQFAIRLLVPEGSRMLELPEMRACVRPFSPSSLTFPWVHADPRVDALQDALARLVGVRLSASRRSVFAAIWEVAHQQAGVVAPPRREEGAMPRATVPYLNEPWYC